MLVQFEITTRCNFDCFYCAGRLMPQADMLFEVFTGLLEQHLDRYGVPEIVSLQGEGEPTLHHDFFRMAEFVRASGSTPYTITNGTYRHPERFVGLFQRIGVSVDSLDEAFGKEIGRYNLPRVLEFIEFLAPKLTIMIHSVLMEPHTSQVAAWCRKQGYRHVVQPLQTKPDYSRRYPSKVPAQRAPTQRSNGAENGRFSCSYLARPRMRYYALDGTELPCCFIKDTREYCGLEAMEAHQRTGTWPAPCIGCRYARVV